MMAVNVKAEPTVPAAQKFLSELDGHIRARYTIAIRTVEEPRFIDLSMVMLSNDSHHRSKPVFHFSRVQGLRKLVYGPKGVKPSERTTDHNPKLTDPVAALVFIANEAVVKSEYTETGAIFILADLGSYLTRGDGVEDPNLSRALREAIWAIGPTKITIIIVGAIWPDVPSLQGLVKLLLMPLPDVPEMTAIVESQVARVERLPECEVIATNETKGSLIKATAGLTATEAKNAILLAGVQYKGLPDLSVPLVLRSKADMIRQSKALGYEEPVPLLDFGGSRNVIRAFERAAVANTLEARLFGVKPRKGMLIFGIPGTGKDYAAKVAAWVLQIPLVKFDMGQIMGSGRGVIGQADLAMDRGLSIVEAVGGCVLHISEFEKSFGGLESSGASDAGASARVIGKLLDWMQEQTCCYVIATANQVKGLQPEQVRSGRFSDIIFNDLPATADRAAVFAVHIRKSGRNPGDFDLDVLAEASDGYVQAEIADIVSDSVLTVYEEKRKIVTTDDVVRSIQNVRPISKTMKLKIESLQEWARDAMASTATGREIGEADLEI